MHQVNCWSQAKVEAQLYHFRDLIKGSTASPPSLRSVQKNTITNHFKRTTSKSTESRLPTQLPQRSTSSPLILPSRITSYFGFNRKSVASVLPSSSSTQGSPQSSPQKASFWASPAFFSFFSRSRSESSLKNEEPEAGAKPEPASEETAEWDVDDQFLYEAACMMDDSKANLALENEENDDEDEQLTYSPLQLSEAEDEEEEAYEMERASQVFSLRSQEEQKESNTSSEACLDICTTATTCGSTSESTPAATHIIPLIGPGSAPAKRTGLESHTTPPIHTSSSTATVAVVSSSRYHTAAGSSAHSSGTPKASLAAAPKRSPVFPFLLSNSVPPPPSGRLSLKRKRNTDLNKRAQSSHPKPTTPSPRDEPAFIDLTESEAEPHNSEVRGTRSSATAKPQQAGCLVKAKSDPSLPRQGSQHSSKRRKLSGSSSSSVGSTPASARHSVSILAWAVPRP